MIVFSQKEFNWVHVDSIGIGTRRCLLSMMVFVNVSVYGLDVQGPVQDCVKEIINDEEWHNGQDKVSECNGVKRRYGIWFVIHVFGK